MKSALCLLLVAVIMCKQCSALPFFFCVEAYAYDPCRGVPDGDYPLCTDCASGYYATCSNGIFHAMPCASAFYEHQGETYFLKMVFDQKTGSCQKYSNSCIFY